MVGPVTSNDGVNTRRSKSYLRLVANTEEAVEPIKIPQHIINDTIDDMKALVPEVDLMDMPHPGLFDNAAIAVIALLLPAC